MQSSSRWHLLGFAIASVLLPPGLGAQASNTNGDRARAGGPSPADSTGIAVHELTGNIKGRQVFNAVAE